jgi:hypothetical protein
MIFLNSVLPRMNYSHRTKQIKWIQSHCCLLTYISIPQIKIGSKVNRQPINKACPGLPAKQHMSEIGSNQRRSCSPIIPSSGRSSSFIFASACINSDSASISAGSTVQFQSICHPSMTVTHLPKISVRHFAWKPVTWAKFLQVLPFVWPFQQCWVLNLRQWYK